MIFIYLIILALLSIFLESRRYLSKITHLARLAKYTACGIAIKFGLSLAVYKFSRVFFVSVLSPTMASSKIQ